MKKELKSEVFNLDCFEYIKSLPDKAFSLALADPPYGINADVQRWKDNGSKRTNSFAPRGVYRQTNWDEDAPSEEFFRELRRVSVNQIIFGANHFIDRLPEPRSTPSWIVWDKKNDGMAFADAELAWTSFPSAVRICRWKWNGMMQEDMAHKEKRIHSTQKPVGLYAWIIKKYCKEGDTILDPFLGSGSSRIAAYKLGFDFVGIEIDETYFKDADKRFREECLDEHILSSGEVIKELHLF